MRASGSSALLERTTTGLPGSVGIDVDFEFDTFGFDMDLNPGEDAPQWEEGAGGGVKPQPGGSTAWLGSTSR